MVGDGCNIADLEREFSASPRGMPVAVPSPEKPADTLNVADVTDVVMDRFFDDGVDDREYVSCEDDLDDEAAEVDTDSVALGERRVCVALCRSLFGIMVTS
jgi:hypothetical protein